MSEFLKENSDIIIYMHSRELVESSLMEFLKNSDDLEENYENLIRIFNDYKIDENSQDLKDVLNIIISFSNNYPRNLLFFSKIEKIILFFKPKIMKFWSNIEKFHIFRTNKRILLFALNEKIVTLDQKILNCFFSSKK